MLLLARDLLEISGALLVLIQSWEYLWVLDLMTSRTHWPTWWEHYRLACRIFSGWYPMVICWYLIFKDTSHHRIVLLQLILRVFRLAWSSWRNKSLWWVWRANIIVLKTIPTLTIGTHRSLFIALSVVVALSLLITTLWNAIVIELESSNVACNR